MTDHPSLSLVPSSIRELIVGHEQLLELLLVAFLSSGHVLIEGPPGTGKTLCARLFAAMLGRSFRRIQFTSDLLPADIIGANMYSPKEETFHFMPGPLFADVVLADEINRTPPRTQSALLEAMEERQVTVDGKSLSLSPLFFLIATQNPHEYEGTFPLPEVQLDRFLFQISVSHANEEAEQRILSMVLAGKLPPPQTIHPKETFHGDALRDAIKRVSFDSSLVSYVSKLIAATRSHPALLAGSSIRGGISLCLAARALATLRQRDYVIADDIKELTPYTLCHRIIRTPEAEVSRVAKLDILAEILDTVPFPS